MVRFYSISKLQKIMVNCSFRGNGKSDFHNYIMYLIFLKSKYVKYKILPFMLPSYTKFLVLYYGR